MPEPINRFLFPFTPQTYVRTTQNAKIIFRIPEDKLTAPSSIRYKKRLIKYAEYKTTLHGWAKSQGFQLSTCGMAIYFFIPIPKRWNNTQRAQSHYQFHDRKPDLSNLLKAFEDALLPKRDQAVGGYSGLGKYWVDSQHGWIEVHTNMPQYDPTTMAYRPMKASPIPIFDNIIKKIESKILNAVVNTFDKEMMEEVAKGVKRRKRK